MSTISKPPVQTLEERLAYLNSEIARLEQGQKDVIEAHESELLVMLQKRGNLQSALDSIVQNQKNIEQHIKSLESRRDGLLQELNDCATRKLQAELDTNVMEERLKNHEITLLNDFNFNEEIRLKNKNTQDYLESVNQDQVKREKGINARLAEISAREANLEAQNQAIIEKKSENEQVASKHAATTNELKNKELTLKQREQQLLSDQQEHQKQLRDLENLREEVTSRKREVENKEQVQSAMKDQLIERESQVQKKERDIQVRDKEYQIRLDEVTYRERVLKNKEKLLNTPEA